MRKCTREYDAEERTGGITRKLIVDFTCAGAQLATGVEYCNATERMTVRPWTHVHFRKKESILCHPACALFVIVYGLSISGLAVVQARHIGVSCIVSEE